MAPAVVVHARHLARKIQAQARAVGGEVDADVAAPGRAGRQQAWRKARAIVFHANLELAIDVARSQQDTVARVVERVVDRMRDDADDQVFVDVGNQVGVDIEFETDARESSSTRESATTCSTTCPTSSGCASNG